MKFASLKDIVYLCKRNDNLLYHCCTNFDMAAKTVIKWKVKEYSKKAVTRRLVIL